MSCSSTRFTRAPQSCSRQDTALWVSSASAWATRKASRSAASMPKLKPESPSSAKSAADHAADSASKLLTESLTGSQLGASKAPVSVRGKAAPSVPSAPEADSIDPSFEAMSSLLAAARNLTTLWLCITAFTAFTRRVASLCTRSFLTASKDATFVHSERSLSVSSSAIRTASSENSPKFPADSSETSVTSGEVGILTGVDPPWGDARSCDVSPS